MSNQQSDTPAVLPQAVSDVLLAFPGNVSHLMPDPALIPGEFHEGLTPWNKLTEQILFGGGQDLSFKVHPAVDGEQAWRHIEAILGSFQPRHEEKASAVAYLFSLWFMAVRSDAGTYGNWEESEQPS